MLNSHSRRPTSSCCFIIFEKFAHTVLWEETEDLDWPMMGNEELLEGLNGCLDLRCAKVSSQLNARQLEVRIEHAFE